MKSLLHLRLRDETLYQPVLPVETEGTNAAAFGFMWNHKRRKKIFKKCFILFELLVLL